MLTPGYIANRAAQLITRSPFGMQISWKGIQVTGVRSVLKRQDAATLSGMDAGYDFTVLISRDEARKWGTQPESLRERLVIDGKPYLLLAVETDVAGNLRLHLGGEYG